MAGVGEAVLAGHLGGPRLNVTALDLDSRAAGTADQMVMVVFGATPVHRLAGVGAQCVDEPVGGHRLQCAIHRGQTDALATAAQFVVQLLGGPELVEVLQQRRDRCALPGGAHPGAARPATFHPGSAHSPPSPAWGIPPTTMSPT